jgi:hypothetical protein
VAAARPPVKETTMRTRMLAAIVLMAVLGSAGCGRGGSNDPTVASAQSGGPTPSASPSASASIDPDLPLKFARCMREQGLTWFPDPVQGKMRVQVPQGVNREQMDAAQEKCKQFMPDGGNAPKPSAEDLEAARQMAKCMRENGIPNFPDPKPDGRLEIDPGKLGTGPDDPTWKKAEAACEKYGPPKGGKQVERHDAGGNAVSGGQGA